MGSEKGTYEVVWPRGKSTTQDSRYAQRPGTLDGKTICELWDRVFRGDKVFAMIAQEMSRRYPGIRFITYDEFGSLGGGTGAKVVASLPEKLRRHECDAVISGVGG